MRAARETPRRPPVISSRKFVKGIVRKISTVFSLKWLYIKWLDANPFLPTKRSAKR